MTPTDLDVALAELTTALGAEGSGRRRYAAAMILNRAGRLSDAALEVYRICSARDGEDPVPLLTRRGLSGEVPVRATLPAAIALPRLVEAADRYLSGLRGAGLAEVRSGLARWRETALAPVATGPNPVVDRWMPTALGALADDRPDLAQAISDALPHLDWITYDSYPPALIGANFAQNHAFASVIGESHAPYPARDWDMGLFLIAPNVLYRDHRHPAPELYAPLTGPHGWRFGISDGLRVLPAHVPVWNPPMRPHMTKVGPLPFLCLFAWTKDVNAPAEVVPASDWAELEARALPL